jgi:hypothetical protein
MQKPRDLTGRKFGRLTVTHKDGSRKNPHHTYWMCQCYCGEMLSVKASHLVTGNTRSCGCLAREHLAKFAKVKDMSGSSILGWHVIRKATDYERKTILGVKPTVRQTYWYCTCNMCGKVRLFTGQILRQGKVGVCKHKSITP